MYSLFNTPVTLRKLILTIILVESSVFPFSSLTLSPLHHSVFYIFLLLSFAPVSSYSFCFLFSYIISLRAGIASFLFSQLPPGFCSVLLRSSGVAKTGS